MAAKWNDKFKKEFLGEKKIAIGGGVGLKNISLSGLEGYFERTYINTVVEMDKTIPAVEKRRIINDAISSAHPLSANKLLDQITSLENEYLSRVPKRYYLITSFSINRNCSLSTVKLNHCTITFHRDVQDRFKKHLLQFSEEAKRSVFGDLPKNYINIKASVKAKSPFHAFDTAMNSVNLYRAFLNLFYNQSVGFRLTPGVREPVNEILLGPLHTLHDSSGKIATDKYSFEPNYRQEMASKDISGNYTDLNRSLKVIRKALNKCRYQKRLESMLIQYVRALDQRDWERSFLSLWSLLELLTNSSGKNTNHKVTVKRASFAFRDREYTALVLDHLRHWRNVIVHEGGMHHDIELLMYDLKRFVEGLLFFHLGRDFSSLKDSAFFMDQPTGQDILKEKISLLKRVVKFTKE